MRQLTRTQWKALVSTTINTALTHLPNLDVPHVDVGMQRFLTALCVLGGIREPVDVGCRVEYIGEGQTEGVGGQDKKEDCFIVNYNIADHTATIIDQGLSGHLRTVSISSVRLPSMHLPTTVPTLQPRGTGASPPLSPTRADRPSSPTMRRFPADLPPAPSVGTEFEKLLHALEDVMQHRKVFPLRPRPSQTTQPLVLHLSFLQSLTPATLSCIQTAAISS